MTTEKIAEFVANSVYDKMPQEGVHIAKMCLLDCLGVSLAGTRESTARIITEYVKELGGKPESGVIGGGFKTCAPLSALANGTIAHALDYDDYAITSACHPTVVLFPALFALASKDGLAGRRILESYIVGWEVGSKLGRELSTSLHGRGWHPTSTVGTLAATAACAKLLGLTMSQTRTALGIAASESSGLNRNFGTDTKPFHAGNAAHSAIAAALLARKGFTANQAALDGAGGFAQVLANKPCNPDTLDSRFDILDSYVIKPYPSCGLTHRCIEAVLHLAKKHDDVRPDQVTAVDCHVPPMFKNILQYSRPVTPLEAKFSMEYCIAAALLDGEITLRQFTEEKISSFRAKEIIPRVTMRFLQGVENRNMVTIPQAVTITLRNGRQFSHEIEWAKGSAPNPMTWDEVVDKFRDCAQHILSAENIERAVKLLETLESQANIDELMNILCRTQR